MRTCLAIFLLVGCGSSDGGGDDMPSCDLTGVATAPADVTLPNPGVRYPTEPFPGLAGTLACVNDADGEYSYATLDLTGDGARDLVITRGCGDPTIGQSVWTVYPGGATGFGAATTRQLPGMGSAYPAQTFPSTVGSVACVNDSDGEYSYATVDLDGDGKLDLVVTRGCGDPTIGAGHWLVFLGSDTGFGEGKPWVLPGLGGRYPTQLFPGLGAAPACTSDTDGEYEYGLVDLTGDGKPDLVLSRGCGDATIGAANWLVYPNTGSGFGPVQPWALPGLGGRYPTQLFTATASNPACTNDTDGQYAYQTIDLDGDKKPDLVLTLGCGDATIGQANWLVYPNTGKGFGPVKTFALPGLGGAYPAQLFSHTAGFTACTSDTDGEYSYAALDVTGDHKPDLVLTRGCGDATIGATQWMVYPNIGTSFGPGQSFALPSVGSRFPMQPFPAVAGTMACTNDLDGEYSYALSPLADEPGIVVTRGCGDATIGSTRWQMFAGQCKP